MTQNYKKEKLSCIIKGKWSSHTKCPILLVLSTFVRKTFSKCIFQDDQNPIRSNG